VKIKAPARQRPQFGITSFIGKFVGMMLSNPSLDDSFSDIAALC